MKDLRRHAIDERADLLSLLEHLSLQQWDAASLCPAWRVRDVVAHVFSYDELSWTELVRQFLRGRLNPGRVNASAWRNTPTGHLASWSRWPDDVCSLTGCRRASAAASRWWME